MNFTCKYTKLDNSMLEDKRFNLISCVVYAKLKFRMQLSINNKHYFDNGYFIVYKINDLAHDIGVGRNSIINALKQLAHYGLVAKVKKMFCQRIYLPKFKMQSLNKLHRESQKQTHESLESKLSYNNKHSNNKDLNNISVCKKFGKSEKSKSVNEYSKHWSTDNRTIININNLSKDFGTKLVVEAIKIATHRDFYTKPFNYISGVVQKLKKHKSNKSKFMYTRQSFKPRRKPIKETMPRWYTHPTKDGKVTQAEKDRIAYWKNRFNQQQAKDGHKFRLD